MAVKKTYLSLSILILANCAGFLIKFIIATTGFTFDFKSYLIVSDIVLNGGNVYSETARYNYAPLWFLVLSTLRAIWSDPQAFHLSIVTLLAVSDFFISLFLYKRVSFFAALIFAINPVSAIISAYYTQFDTLAILLGLIGVDLSLRSQGNLEKRQDKINAITGSIFLGLSLCTKHSLIFLPLCLLIYYFLNNKKSFSSILIFALPYLVFLGSFVPFITLQNSSLIVSNVLLYQSSHNVGLFRGIIEHLYGQTLQYPFMFAALLLASTATVAILTASKASVIEFFAFHLATVFIFLPGMAPQYLVFILPFWALFCRNTYMMLAVLCSTFLLIGISPGLQISWIDHRFLRLAIIQLLVLAALCLEIINIREKKKGRDVKTSHPFS